MKSIGNEVVELVEDYAAAIDALGDRAAANTVAAARKSLDGLLGKLRRSYNTFLDEAVPDRPSGRRPLEYTIAETTARYRDLTTIAAEFLPESEIQELQRRYQKDLAEAIGKGGELQAQLVKLIDPRRATPFAGPDPAVVKAAAERTSAFIRGEAMAFRDGLTKIALDGVAKGSGYKTILKDVKMLLQGAADPDGITRSMGLERRAELIARSELSNAYVEAQRRYTQAGGYRYVRVIAVGDERTCLTCGGRSGRIFRADEITAPFHPRCRCVLAAVPNEAVEEQDPELRRQLLDDEFWEQQREEGRKVLAAANGWDTAKVEAKIRANLQKPTSSERRLYPDLKRSAQAVD
jgi:SPP1 gp7 family putative phage head morphogenesis protein